MGMREMSLVTIAIVAACQSDTNSFVGDLQLNEMMLSNTWSHHNEKNEYLPWIEILNTDERAIDLSNHLLVNHSNTQTAYLPNTSIEPGEYIVVFLASEDSLGSNVFDERTVPFETKGVGGLQIINKEHVVIASMQRSKESFADVSEGHPFDVQNDQSYYLTQSTPGAQNSSVERPLHLSNPFTQKKALCLTTISSWNSLAKVEQTFFIP